MGKKCPILDIRFYCNSVHRTFRKLQNHFLMLGKTKLNFGNKKFPNVNKSFFDARKNQTNFGKLGQKSRQ